MPGRNEPCPCGSGRKYKRCCLERERGAGGRGAARTGVSSDPFAAPFGVAGTPGAAAFGAPPGPARRGDADPGGGSAGIGSTRPADTRRGRHARSGSGPNGASERLPPAGPAREKLLERVAKLYRMSAETESSPHEAAIALRRCQALMARYGITEKDLETSAFGAAAFRAASRRTPAHVLFLAQAVALLHDCIVVQGEELEFRGYALDAEVAALTFDYLSEAMERSLAERKRDGAVPGGRAAAFDYRVGYATTVLERCRDLDRERRAAEEAAARADGGDGRALVVRKREAVERECASGLASARARKVRVRAGDALAAGETDGRDVSLSTQLG